MSAGISLPRRIHIGAGASGQLLATLAEFGLHRPMIVTDAFMVSCGYLKQVVAPLEAAGIPVGLFADCVPDPTTDSIAAGLALLSAYRPDVVVGLGGGSSMDTAKAMAVMAERSGQLRDYKAPVRMDTGLPIIAIPTTAGTGSEATGVAVVTDTENDEKMLCLGIGLMPLAALVDYELTLSMPLRLTADTGLDTLCHALEAFVSQKANPFTDALACDVIAAVPKWLPIACADPGNAEAREAMMMAALKGGMAFSNASVTLIHGMSRPIGAHFHVPHGMSNAMLLPIVTAWSLPGAPERYAQASRLMGFASDSDSEDRALELLVTGLTQLCTDLAVPTPRAFGISEADWFGIVDTMAAQAIASGSPANNPRVPDHAQIMALYKQVWQTEVV